MRLVNHVSHYPQLAVCIINKQMPQQSLRKIKKLESKYRRPVLMVRHFCFSIV